MSANNAELWFNFSQKRDLDIVSKFVILWVAFNWEYAEFSKFGTLGERASIRNLCKDKHKKKLLLDYDPFAKGETDVIDIFKKRPVYDASFERYVEGLKLDFDGSFEEKMEYVLSDSFEKLEQKLKTEIAKRYKKAYEDSVDYYNKLCNGDPEEKMVNLILTIYQVRCNLFHGSKTPSGPRETRDSLLIESSAEIMEEYMKRLLGRDEWS